MSEARQFTAQEIESMRALIAQHDQTFNPAKVFDLNNPPKENYRHQEYPRCLYAVNESGAMVSKVVADRESHEAHLADGWVSHPSELNAAFEPPEPEKLDPASQAEVDALTERIAKAKAKKRGA